MGYIRIDSASFTTTKPQININTIVANYTCTIAYALTPDTSEPSGHTYDGGTVYWSEFSFFSYPSYNWSFAPSNITSTTQSGTVTTTNLTAGNEHTLTATLTVSFTERELIHSRTDTWIPGRYTAPYAPNPGPEPQASNYTDPDQFYLDWQAWNDANTAYQTYINSWVSGYWSSTYSSYYLDHSYTDTQTITITAYTKPAGFTFDLSPGVIIQSAAGLTAAKVNDWCAHCNQYAHWYNQNNTDVVPAACYVNSNELITAAWYNACADAIPNSPVAHVSGGLNGTLISASIIEELATAISV